MKKFDYFRLIDAGVEEWNAWRNANYEETVDLSGAVLTRKDLSGFDFTEVLLAEADLTGAKLMGAKCFGTDLSSATLTDANMVDCELYRATIVDANLSGASLEGASLMHANLIDANLSNTRLFAANFTGAWLRGVNFYKSQMDSTVFGDNDFRQVHNLDSVVHRGPLVIGVDALYASNGQIPQVFLRNCDFPENFITEILPLIR